MNDLKLIQKLSWVFTVQNLIWDYWADSTKVNKIWNQTEWCDIRIWFIIKKISHEIYVDNP